MTLTFLSAFMRRHSITQSDAAERLGLLGIGRTTLFDTLRSDDILVSRLFDIAHLTGWTLRIRIVDAGNLPC